MDKKIFLYVSCIVVSCVLVAHGLSNDLTGLRAAGNKLVNHKNQRVVLRVSKSHARVPATVHAVCDQHNINLFNRTNCELVNAQHCHPPFATFIKLESINQ